MVSLSFLAVSSRQNLAVRLRAVIRSKEAVAVVRYVMHRNVHLSEFLVALAVERLFAYTESHRLLARIVVDHLGLPPVGWGRRLQVEAYILHGHPSSSTSKVPDCD